MFISRCVKLVIGTHERQTFTQRADISVPRATESRILLSYVAFLI